MIKKLQITTYQEMMGYGIDLGQTVNKVNEIIDYLNEQEKINSYRVNLTHQDSIAEKNTTYKNC